MTIALAAGVAVGLPPAFAARGTASRAPSTAKYAISGPSKSRVRSALIVIQMAVATVVLAVVGVSLHSLFNLRHVSLGFSARHLIYGSVDVRRSGYNAEAAPAFLQRMRQRVQAVPRIEAVTLASDPPMMGYSMDHDDDRRRAEATGGRGDDMAYIVVERPTSPQSVSACSRGAHSIPAIGPDAPKSPS